MKFGIMAANFLFGDGEKRAKHVDPGLLFHLAGVHRRGHESRSSRRPVWRSSRSATCYTTMDMATLDQLSDGRVFLGAGAG
jgi:hypothetical protein